MATIYVDGKEYEVKGSENLLQACLSLGLDIPYFCWHPALGGVGSCRQCAVKQFKDKDDKRGRLVMSCMVPAAEGSVIAIDDEEAVAFRKSVVEWLMTNHPHDCPVCAEGGNCHLQDMTVMTGHSFRRYRFSKRTHQNQDLGPFVAHQMNRCIACYRCVRYYKDYADGSDLGVFGAHNNVYFGRVEDGTLESEFSGNLVEVCPTGVFTDKTHTERYNRKWDMQFAPSVCQQCSLGCNISPGERYGELRRIENRYNGTLNHYFLCDRGRFGYGYVNLKDRPKHPQKRASQTSIQLDAELMLEEVSNVLDQSKKVIGIGSARASLESNLALKSLVGASHFYTGLSQLEMDKLNLLLKILKEGGIPTPSLREIEAYDAVLVLGEDITQTGARMALAVRQALKRKAQEMSMEGVDVRDTSNMSERDKAAILPIADWQAAALQNVAQGECFPLFVTNTDKTRLEDVAKFHYCAPAEDQARLGFAIAHAIDGNAPAVEGLSQELQEKAEEIAKTLSNAKKPLIISGTQVGLIEVLEAAANVAKALKEKGSEVGIALVAEEVNSVGLGMIGGGSVEEALNQLETRAADTVIILENDLSRHISSGKVHAALEKAQNIIVLDHQTNAITDKANYLLSAASFAEGDGTVVNNEGRAQRFFQVYDPAFYDTSVVMAESWRWIYAIRNFKEKGDVNWGQLDAVIENLTAEFPELKALKDVAPNADFRILGQKLPRSPQCSSGRTAMRADISVHEPRQPQDPDSMFAFSMEGNNQPSAARSEVPFAWAPGWNSPQAWNKFQDEVGGHLRHGDPGKRFFETASQGLHYFTKIPAAFQPHAGKWRIVPDYQLFGSEELSQRSPVFQKRMSKASASLNRQEADRIGLKAGEMLSLEHEGKRFELPVTLSENLSEGQVALPLGYPTLAPEMAYKNCDLSRRMK